MGEASRRRAEQRKIILLELDAFLAPASQWESDLVAEINALPTLTVPRASADQLAWAKMKPRACHQNCQWQEANDPEGKTTSVDGWWKQPIGLYLHHSVVLRDGQHICITPTPTWPFEEIEFAPDPKLAWRDIDGGRFCERNGRRVGLGVRVNPARTIREYTLVRDRVLAGMDPMKAGVINPGDLDP